ncbi:tRNA lysidine(34) synthetase [Syntrophus aciditrophicus]|uniref:tRNA s2C32 biosynthesis protein n=1 Tax=Syntrophus aciditrophicus (strain SB) TaxID=56780 RepID=Q2LU45_SYNAS|nr:ATP-binding protein [Syntrophus aciditrophicus]ABC77608.1 tRNA s2C32 biosynthesis protein [Syntrophus aciditrophicus SB]OPY16012.1 MAG: tRNA 2-thiocytidine biosynthesis protein TtcA [Syntrophus sp. PtaB.Bin075]
MQEGKKTKLFYHLKKWLEKAIMDYRMIEEGDHVLVGVSGGADSLALLDLLNTPMIFVPEFSLTVVHIDPGFDPDAAGYDRLESYMKAGGYNYVMEKTDIGPLSHSDYNKKNPCFLCSRLRRKRIFEIAGEIGCNKIALAHHQDDMIETLLINMFYGREISTMMPDQPIFGGSMHIIRPLTYIREELIKKYSREREFPIVESSCPTNPVSRRRYIKNLLDSLEKENKDIRANIFKAMSHVKMDYLPGLHRIRKSDSCGMEIAALIS